MILWVYSYTLRRFHVSLRSLWQAIAPRICALASAFNPKVVVAVADSATRERMAEAYRYSAELEWMFWDSAYQLGAWPTR